MTESYYTLLEVSRSASQAEIKEAFIKLIRQVHPDLLANVPEYWKHQAEEKSKDINEAYRVLSDPAKRRSYDQQFGAQAQQPQAADIPHDDNQGVSSSTAASSRRPTRSWPAVFSSFWKGRVAALLCFLVITGPCLVLGRPHCWRRRSTPASSAVSRNSIPTQRPSSGVTQNRPRKVTSKPATLEV